MPNLHDPVSAEDWKSIRQWLDENLSNDDHAKIINATFNLLAAVKDLGENWHSGTYLTIGLSTTATVCVEGTIGTLQKNASLFNRATIRAADEVFVGERLKPILCRMPNQDCFRLEWGKPQRRAAVAENVKCEVIRHADKLLKTQIEIVESAEQFLLTTGSRTRHFDYLNATEQCLKSRPSVHYYRVLFGPPHFEDLMSHLESIVERDRVYLAIIEDSFHYSEAFICGNDKAVLVAQPSFNGLSSNYDSAIVYRGQAEVKAFENLVKDFYRVGRKLKSIDEVNALGTRIHDNRF